MRLHWRLTIGVVEAAMVIFVLFAAAWQFGEWAFGPGLAGGGEPESLAERMPAFDGSYLMLAILLVAALYGLFQVFGRSGLALWTVAILVILAQMPGIWSHNKLSWGKFMGIETAMGEGHSLMLGGTLFVASLLGLVILHRLIALRKLGGVLTQRRVDASERDTILANEGLALTVIVAVALVLALLLVGAGSGIAGPAWIASNVPWAVVTIGGGASVLLIAFIALFIRSLTEEASAPESGSGG